jgi:hypothetical protein
MSFCGEMNLVCYILQHLGGSLQETLQPCQWSAPHNQLIASIEHPGYRQWTRHAQFRLIPAIA